MDKKLREIDIMVTLLEAKLNSLPAEIASKYPEIVHCSIDDITPEIVINKLNTTNSNSSQNKTLNNTNHIDANDTTSVRVSVKPSVPEEIKEEEKVQEEIKQPEEIPQTPEEKLRAYVENGGEELEKFYKMLKFGVPPEAVIQKAMFSGFNTDLIKVIC
jgi:hypothetical protein